MPSRQSVIRKRYVKEIKLYGALTCGICGFPIIRAGDLTVDHVVPKAHGGASGVRNFQPAHFVCNQRKGMRADYKLTTETKE